MRRSGERLNSPPISISPELFTFSPSDVDYIVYINDLLNGINLYGEAIGPNAHDLVKNKYSDVGTLVEADHIQEQTCIAKIDAMRSNLAELISTNPGWIVREVDGTFSVSMEQRLST